jgi:hypothetical protein
MIVSLNTERDDFFTHDLYRADCVMGTITHDFESSTRVKYLTFNIWLIITLLALAKIYNFLGVSFPDQILWLIEGI